MKPLSLLTKTDIEVMSREKLLKYQQLAEARLGMSDTLLKKGHPGAQADYEQIQTIKIYLDERIRVITSGKKNTCGNYCDSCRCTAADRCKQEG